MNLVLLIGRVCSLPVYVDGRLDLATTDPWRDTTRTTVHRVRVVGRALAAYGELDVGTHVLVVGRLDTGGEVVATRLDILAGARVVDPDLGPPAPGFDEEDLAERIQMQRKPKREKVQLAETLAERADRLRRG